MLQVAIVILAWLSFGVGSARAEAMRAAYPSANVQFLPAFVALEKRFL